MTTRYIFFTVMLTVGLVTAAPDIFAQKKGLVQAAKNLAKSSARETAVNAKVPAEVFKNLADGTAAALREASADPVNIPELEQALQELSVKITARANQNTLYLITAKVKDPALKAELTHLVKKRRIREAAALLASRSVRVSSAATEPAPPVQTPVPAPVQSPEALEKLLRKLDYNSGPDVVRAARLLADAKENGLVSRARYLALLETLESGKPEKMFKILRREIPSAFMPSVNPSREEKIWSSLMIRERRNDLTPRQMELPESDRQLRALAIRKVLGKQGGLGQKQKMPAYKQFYDKQPVWVQEDLDRQISGLEDALKQKLAGRLAESNYKVERNDFSRSVYAFFSGRISQSPQMLEYLYSSHVPAALKKELRGYIDAVPQEREARKVYAAKVREFFDVWSANKAAGVHFPSVQDEKLFNRLLDLLDFRGNPKRSPADRILWAELVRSPDPLTAACARRALAVLDNPSLEQLTLNEFKEFVAQHNRLPESSGQLYHRIQRFKDHPNAFQREFVELFEKYRKRDKYSPGRPRKN